MTPTGNIGISKPLYTSVNYSVIMGEARRTILMKSAQMQKMNHQFHGDNVMDAMNIVHFSDSLVYNPFNLLEE